MVTAYLLASTATTPVWGKLSDRYGRRYLFLTAIMIFLVGSALSGYPKTWVNSSPSAPSRASAAAASSC